MKVEKNTHTYGNSDSFLHSQRGIYFEEYEDIKDIISSQKYRIAGKPFCQKNNILNDVRNNNTTSTILPSKKTPIRLLPVVQRDRNHARGAKNGQACDLHNDSKRFEQFERQSSGLWRTVRKLPYVQEIEKSVLVQQPSIKENVCMDHESAKVFVPYNDDDFGYMGEIHHGYHYYVPVCTPVNWHQDRIHEEKLPPFSSANRTPKPDITLRLSHRDDGDLSIPGKQYDRIPSRESEDNPIAHREHCAFCDNPLFKAMYCPLKHRAIDLLQDFMTDETFSRGSSISGAKLENPHILLTKSPQILLYDKTNLAKVYRQNQMRKREAMNLLDDIGELNEFNQHLKRNLTQSWEPCIHF